MVQAERVHLEYSNRSDKFRLTKDEDLEEKTFRRQYYHVYNARLEALKQRIVENAQKTIGFFLSNIEDDSLDSNLEHVQLENAEQGKTAFVIGTIEKRTKKRPSVLKELVEEEVLADVVEDTSANIDGEDFIELEDETQIVKIQGNFENDDLATGCTVGLVGKQVKDNLFHVEHVVWPLPAVQRPWPLQGPDAVIAFVSGLSFTGDMALDQNTFTAFSLFSRWVAGQMDLSDAESEFARRVARVVILGESIAVTNEGRDFANAARYLIRNEQCPNVNCMSFFDKLLSKLTGALPVDVMPGIGDPTSQLLPQQPIHRCALKISAQAGRAMNSVTNPYEFSLDDLDFLCLSGQNVTDIRRLSDTPLSGCDVLSRLVRWQHMSPTSPDTVDSFPFSSRDPFVMDSTPHVIVAGNQTEHESRLEERADGTRTLYVCVPRFTQSLAVTLVDLRNTQVTHRYFGL